MTDQSASIPDLEKAFQAESAPEKGIEDKAQRKIEFNPGFTLGHPYLQAQWRDYEKAAKMHKVKAAVVIAVLIATAVLSINLFYHLIPLFCLGFGAYKYRRWRKQAGELDARGKMLRSASWAVRDQTTADVKYTVEDHTPDPVPCVTSSNPNARIMVDGNSVPKYCGSWRIKNWKALTEGERIDLHSDHRTYSRGMVYHGTTHSYAMVTDTGVTLWFV
jgi:hypothetical protein